MKRVLTVVLIAVTSVCFSQIPSKVLVGYWQNWDAKHAPYFDLDRLDDAYNVVNVSFAVPKRRTTYNMWFEPRYMSDANFRRQVQTLQSQGRIVNISIGGGGNVVELKNKTQKAVFVKSMLRIINTYGFDGIDIDLEGKSVRVTGGTISQPRDAKVVYLIQAIKEIMAHYQAQHGKKLILTMAPETAFVQGGMIKYGKYWGAYLPLIDALRYDIDLIFVQLYNSGTMRGLDGGVYTVGTGDFIVSMTEALLQGFNTDGGYFQALRQDQIVVGLPCCPRAAGSGHTHISEVRLAMNYLLGRGERVGYYSLRKPDGYPGIRGMMTWSVNWDKSAYCGTSNEFAWNYRNIFLVPWTPKEVIVPEPIIVKKERFIYPNSIPNKLFAQIESPNNEVVKVSLVYPKHEKTPAIWINTGVKKTCQIPLERYFLQVEKELGMDSKRVILRK